MGDSTSKLYRRWWSMNVRCNYPSSPSYKNYGGRGIQVCKEWHQENPEGWHNFKKWMLSQGYDETAPWGSQTIDRIDVYKGYCPSNCRLISMAEQQTNKRENIYLTYKNETHCMGEWARLTGLSVGCIKKRIKKGMTPEEIFSNPLKKTNQTYCFSYNGKTYTSLTSFSKEYSINMKRLSYLIHKGQIGNLSRYVTKILERSAELERIANK